MYFYSLFEFVGECFGATKLRREKCGVMIGALSHWPSHLSSAVAIVLTS